MGKRMAELALKIVCHIVWRQSNSSPTGVGQGRAEEVCVCGVLALRWKHWIPGKSLVGFKCFVLRRTQNRHFILYFSFAPLPRS